VAAWLRGPGGRRGPPPAGQHAARTNGCPRAWCPHRPRADPSGRPGDGRRHAGADAHGGGLAPGALPGRANASTGRVLQQAARLSHRGPVLDPRSHAGHGRVRHGRHRGPQALGRHADQAGEPDRGSGRTGRGHQGPPRRRDLTAPPWTGSSTSTATSCRAWAMQATASSEPVAPGSRPFAKENGRPSGRPLRICEGKRQEIGAGSPPLAPLPCLHARRR